VFAWPFLYFLPRVWPAARLDFETCGIEPSRWAAEYARSRLGLDVREGSLDDVELPAASFDVITLNDVIGH